MCVYICIYYIHLKASLIKFSFDTLTNTFPQFRPENVILNFKKQL